MSESSTLRMDALKSLSLWRIWLFLGKQDIKARFRGSFIGPLWIFLNMGLFIGGAGVVYGLMFGQPMHEFLPFLTMGFVIWAFLVSSLTEAATTFVIAEGYIKQFSYPKQIYLARSLVSYVIIFSIGLTALVLLQMFYSRFSLLGWLMAVPGFFVLIAAAVGHITIFAYLGARFRDLPHAMSGLLQVLFFVTPIMFPVKILADRHLDFVYKYNPLYYLIEVVRTPILASEFPSPAVFVSAIAYVVFVWVVAVITARRLDSRVVYFL